VHVAVRRREIRVAGQFLNGPRGRPLHRQVRTERVPQDVHALFDPRDALSPTHGFDDPVTGDRRSVRQGQHPLASQMPSSSQGCRQSLLTRRVIAEETLGTHAVALPFALTVVLASLEANGPQFRGRAGVAEGNPPSTWNISKGTNVDVGEQQWRPYALDRRTGAVVWQQTAERAAPRAQRPLQEQLRAGHAGHRKQIVALRR
jgi:hypothetical protein